MSPKPWVSDLGKYRTFRPPKWRKSTGLYPSINRPVSVNRPSSFRRQTIQFLSKERPLSVNIQSRFLQYTVQFPSTDRPVSFNRPSSFRQKAVHFPSIDRPVRIYIPQNAENTDFTNRKKSHFPFSNMWKICSHEAWYPWNVDFTTRQNRIFRAQKWR